jgi:hypothetical protein
LRCLYEITILADTNNKKHLIKNVYKSSKVLNNDCNHEHITMFPHPHVSQQAIRLGMHPGLKANNIFIRMWTQYNIAWQEDEHV